MHGQIVPISYNVPTIAMCNHPKHAGLMRKLDVGEYTIDIGDKKFSESIIETIISIENPNCQYVNKLMECNRKMMEQTSKTFEKIKALKI